MLKMAVASLALVSSLALAGPKVEFETTLGEAIIVDMAGGAAVLSALRVGHHRAE